MNVNKNESKELAINGGMPIRRTPWPLPHSTDAKDRNILCSVFEQENWSNGFFVKAFERQIAKFCGCKHALFVVNGTAALKISFVSIGIEKGDEIIIPGMTWPSVVFGILECGAIPVPVDIDDGYGLAIDGVKRAITPKTKAIIATHLFCSQTDLPPLLDVAQAKGIHVIEDATHVLGTKRFGQCLGTFGTAGFFSFNHKKILSCGEGGCLVTNDSELIEKARTFREVSSDQNVPGTCLPQSAKASDFLAAILSTQLEKLPAKLKIQENRAEYLRKELNRLNNVEVLPRLSGTDMQTFYNFCFKVKGIKNIQWFRDALSKELSLKVTAPYIPFNKSLALSEIIKKNLFNAGNSLSIKLKNTERAYKYEGARFHYRALLDSLESMEDILRAVEKVLRYCG